MLENVMDMQEDGQQIRFKFRNMKPTEADRLVFIEHTCFPAQQAIPEKCLRDLMAIAGDFYLVAVDIQTGEPVASLFGLATNEEIFRDDFFLKAALHEQDGKNVMLLGLEVLPEYRGCGLARTLMERYLDIERKRNRHKVCLTCLKEKIGMYEKMGFENNGVSSSVLGGETWYDMSIILN